jgi:hypothetical protein
MKIKWKKVTWYSSLLAIILFVLTFYVGFNLGNQNKEIANNNKSEPIQKKLSEKAAPISSPVSITPVNLAETNFTGTTQTISGSGVLASSARAYIEKQVGEFRKLANTDVPDMRTKFGADSPLATYTIDIEATDIKSSKTESIAVSVYTFTGGAHGVTIYKVITSTISNGKNAARILSLSDIVPKSKQTAFTEFVKKELNAWRPDGSGPTVVFPDDVKNLTFSSFNNWALDDTKLSIYFDQDTIGPGVLGAVAFPLPFDKIKDFIDLNTI